MAKVSLVKGNSRYGNIYGALELIKDELGLLAAAKKILVKPNLTGRRTALANTHPQAVAAFLDFVRDNFSAFERRRFLLLEGSGEAHYTRAHTRDVFYRFGFFDLLKKYPNLGIKTVEEAAEFSAVSVVTTAGKGKVGLAAELEEFDLLVSLAIPKTHDTVVFTGGIKNVMGLVRQEDKGLMHGIVNDKAEGQISKIERLGGKLRGAILSRGIEFLPEGLVRLAGSRLPAGMKDLLAGRRNSDYEKSVGLLNRNLAFLAKSAWPGLTVLDGFEAMEGDGPVYGTALELKAAVASVDPLKADGLGARLLGFNPSGIGYLWYLQKDGLGDYSLGGLVGEKVKDVAVEARPHRSYHLQKRWV